MNREELYKLNNELRWERYELILKLRHIEKYIEDVNFFIKNPLELKRKYTDTLDYVNRSMIEIFDSLEHFFKYSKSLRKEIHSRLSNLKKKRKEVKDKLSLLPKNK